MPIFDDLFLLMILLTALSLCLPQKLRSRCFAPVSIFCGVTAVLHLLIGGYRWSMIPAYFLAVCFTINGLFSLRQRSPSVSPSRKRLIFRGIVVLLTLAVLVIAVIFAKIFQEFLLPRPTGAYGIGTTSMTFVDRSRREIFSNDASARRRVMIQIWYPASPTSYVVRPHIFPVRQHPLFDDRTLAVGYAAQDVPVVAGVFPIVVFSHGYDLVTTQNTAQMEELASHGYVAVSISHPYESLAVVYPDGSSAHLSMNRILQVVRDMRQGAPYGRKFAVTTNARQKANLLRQWLRAIPSMAESVRIWTDDTKFVLDQLQRLDSTAGGGSFRDKLDMTRVGVMGMSFGGAVAAQVCIEDRRCKAGINMDGTQFGDLVDHPLETPFLFMDAMHDPEKHRLFFDEAKAPAYYVVIRNAHHLDYSDFCLLPHKTWLGTLGPIQGDRMESIMNAYMLALFDHYLKGKTTPLLDTSVTPYSEVIFDRR
jgi:predicted dienelactone hydrolase